jgi:hypothetical protein
MRIYLKQAQHVVLFELSGRNLIGPVPLSSQYAKLLISKRFEPTLNKKFPG